MLSEYEAAEDFGYIQDNDILPHEIAIVLAAYTL